MPQTHIKDLDLVIDVGTGSVRAALVNGLGEIVCLCAEEHDQIVLTFGWAEQRPHDWWSGVIKCVRGVLSQIDGATHRIGAICACGQMHGTVFVDQNGRLLREASPLWNDKRTVELVRAFEAEHRPQTYLAETGNPPTPAWPGFKLAWFRAHEPHIYSATAKVLMPKDYINLQLTGCYAMDTGDASCSFLMDPTRMVWSDTMIEVLGLDKSKLPEIRRPIDILGHITGSAAAETGLLEGTPVLVGGADYPVSILGSGAARLGLASDVTGTSCILTVITQRPLLDPEICNVATIEGNWGSFVLLESGGDAIRWARRAFHEKSKGYAEIAALAAQAPVGSDSLFFLPFLSGERLGAHRNARAQFFGLGAGHGLSHLHRSILEGVAFAAARYLRVMEETSGTRLERVVASGGGAKSELWLKIKASIYGIPIMVPKQAECGLIGCAAIAATATGRFAKLQDAVAAYVQYDKEILPDPAWIERYERMQPVFNRIYTQSQSLYSELDALASPAPS